MARDTTPMISWGNKKVIVGPGAHASVEDDFHAHERKLEGERPTVVELAENKREEVPQ